MKIVHISSKNFNMVTKCCLIGILETAYLISGIKIIMNNNKIELKNPFKIK